MALDPEIVNGTTTGMGMSSFGPSGGMGVTEFRPAGGMGIRPMLSERDQQALDTAYSRQLALIEVQDDLIRDVATRLVRLRYYNSYLYQYTLQQLEQLVLNCKSKWEHDHFYPWVEEQVQLIGRDLNASTEDAIAVMRQAAHISVNFPERRNWLLRLIRGGRE